MALRPPPGRPLEKKLLSHPISSSTFLHPYITVNFQLRSSINVGLTESFVYNRLYVERSPKWGFGGDFGDRGEDIWWEAISVLRIARF